LKSLQIYIINPLKLCFQNRDRKKSFKESLLKSYKINTIS